MSRKSEMVLTSLPVIGIIGAPASGKESAARIIRDSYGFEIIGVSAALSDYANALDVPTPFARDALRETYWRLVPILGDNLLARYIYDGLAISVKRGLYGGSVIEGFRIQSDITYLKDRLPKFRVLGIDADKEIRFERILKRRRLADISDRETFERIEEKEDPWIKSAMKMADTIIVNEGSEEDLVRKVKSFVEENYSL